MLKTLATVFGVAMLAIGALGFVPGATTDDGMLLGIFHVNPAHNVIHLLTGAAAIWAGMTSTKYARTFFQVFGVVYGLIALMGFFMGDKDMLLGIVANNEADNWLHVAIALTSLAIGFLVKDEEETTAVTRT